MITLALHHDESVFVHLSETGTNKKTIEQLGFFSTDFHVDRNFLLRSEAKNRLSQMFGNVLKVLKTRKETCIFSIPADLCHFSFYHDIPGDKVQELVDRDLWLTGLKLGKSFIEESDCQVKIVHKQGGLVSVTAIYFPNVLYGLFAQVCREYDCSLDGIGINLFNDTEIAKELSAGRDYWLLSMGKDEYELLHMNEDTITALARFSGGETDEPLFLVRQGEIPDALCSALLQRRSEDLGTYMIFVTVAGSDTEQAGELGNKVPRLRILDPMLLDKYYQKPGINYDEKYNTVFSCALGALI